MNDWPPAPVPERPSPASLRRAVQQCRACDLYEGATQPVMGEGPRRAEVMLVGEQPGDREDIEGHPFVGPAGRRIHQTPDGWQVKACLPWLNAEIETVKPAALVCLGATAAQALLGPRARIGKDRGRPMPSGLAELVTITTHPSAILRARDADRKPAMEQFVGDLQEVSRWLRSRRH